MASDLLNRRYQVKSACSREGKTNILRLACAAGCRLLSRTDGRNAMAKGERHGNRETKKPKKEKPKTIAAAPSLKGGLPKNNPGGKK